MNNFVRLSLETHLFFSRIMKEHALFLEAGFPGLNADWIQSADAFKCHFENLLCETVQIANSNVGSCILQSGELITQFTVDAERHTERLISTIQTNDNFIQIYSTTVLTKNTPRQMSWSVIYCSETP